MFTLFLRAIFLYSLMIFTMRLLGKRQLGEFEPYELVFTILLADIISGPIGSVSTPLFHGILPVAAVVVVHGTISIACVKSDKIRSVISGRPTVIVNRGEIDMRAVNRLCLSLSDVLEGLRCAGFLNPADVGTAVVEANGKITAFASCEKRPPCMADLRLPCTYEGLPMMLVIDGRIQQQNLKNTGRNEAWLRALLDGQGIAAENVALASLDTAGKMSVQLKNAQPLRFQAMEAGEVAW